MDERFPDEFVTWKHKTPIGVKVEEVFGMDSKNGKVWIEFAHQIFCEQGEQNYRIIDHFENGAPFLEGYPGRISITHTRNFFAIAMLPKTPEVNLGVFTPRASMGIDAESLDRQQVIKIRNKFLSEEELTVIPDDNLEKNIQAWTAKEALYKSAFFPGLDFKNNIRIIELPDLSLDPENKYNLKLGKALIIFPVTSDIQPQDMILYSYKSYGCCVSIALSPKAAKFGS